MSSPTQPARRPTAADAARNGKPADGLIAAQRVAVQGKAAVRVRRGRRPSDFVVRHPTVKMLALSFLILIGVMLIVLRKPAMGEVQRLG